MSYPRRQRSFWARIKLSVKTWIRQLPEKFADQCRSIGWSDFCCPINEFSIQRKSTNNAQFNFCWLCSTTFWILSKTKRRTKLSKIHRFLFGTRQSPTRHSLSDQDRLDPEPGRTPTPRFELDRLSRNRQNIRIPHLVNQNLQISRKFNHRDSCQFVFIRG